jgi:hypothetical protein
MPSTGRKRSDALFGLNIAQRTCAPLSFKVKYRCPDAGFATLDSSPSIHTNGNTSPSRSRTSRLSTLGVRMLRDDIALSSGVCMDLGD